MWGGKLRVRTSKITYNVREVIAQGYEKFDTAETGEGDGEQFCMAKIYYYRPTDTLGAVGFQSGKTGFGMHAEMDALCGLLKLINWNVEAFKQCNVAVECTSKPCCLLCASILGHLGIGPTTGTYKNNKRMGSTQWGIVSNLRNFVSEYTGIPARVFEYYDNPDMY